MPLTENISGVIKGAVGTESQFNGLREAGLFGVVTDRGHRFGYIPADGSPVTMLASSPDSVPYVEEIDGSELITIQQGATQRSIQISALSEWTGTLVLGETNTTAYRGDRGKTAYDHSQVSGANPHNTTYSQVGAAAASHSHLISDVTDLQTALDAKTSLTLGETSSTAYRGDRGKIAYDHSQITAANPHGTTTAQISEATNLYFTYDRVRSVTLAGYAVGSNTALAATDSLLASFGKIQAQLNGKLSTTLKGAVNGLAELDANGKVPSSQMYSYVDDVVEYSSVSAFPASGEAGKIYVTLDTNLTYRWSGSAYVEISASLALGETSSTAYRGDRGKTAYDHSQITGQNPHGTTTAQVTEATNLYFTEARVRATPLTGYAVGSNSSLAASDTLLGAFGKVQGQLNAKQPSLTNPVTGTGATGQLAVWTSTGVISGDSGLTRILTSGVATALGIGNSVVSASVSLVLQAATGSGSVIRFSEGGIQRWKIINNTGGDLRYEALDSSGVSVDFPISCLAGAGSPIILGGNSSTKRNTNFTGNLLVGGSQFLSSGKALNVASALVTALAHGSSGSYLPVAADYLGNVTYRTAAQARSDIGASDGKELYNWYSSQPRPTDCNLAPDGFGGIRSFKATSAMTANKPPQGDSHIINLGWDSTEGYDSQLAIRSVTGAIQSRGCTAGVWTAWRTIWDDVSLPASATGKSLLNAADAASARTTIGNTYRNEAVNNTSMYPGTNSGYFLLNTAAEAAIPSASLVDGLVVKMKAYFYASVNTADYFSVIASLSETNTNTYPGAYDSRDFWGSTGIWPGQTSGRITISVEIRLGAITSGTIRRAHYLWSVCSNNQSPLLFANDSFSIDVSVPLYPHLAIDLAGSGSINRYVYSVEIQKP